MKLRVLEGCGNPQSTPDLVVHGPGLGARGERTERSIRTAIKFRLMKLAIVFWEAPSELDSPLDNTDNGTPSGNRLAFRVVRQGSVGNLARSPSDSSRIRGAKRFPFTVPDHESRFKNKRPFEVCTVRTSKVYVLLHIRCKPLRDLLSGWAAEAVISLTLTGCFLRLCLRHLCVIRVDAC